MKTLSFNKENYSISFNVDKDKAYVVGGAFKEILVGKTELFSLVCRDIKCENDFLLEPQSFNSVLLKETGDSLEFLFSLQEKYDIKVKVTAVFEENGVTFYTDIINEDDGLSVLEAFYPTPNVISEKYDLFYTWGPGKIIKNFPSTNEKLWLSYPSTEYAMQYFAVLAENSSLYVGYHDRGGNVKYYYFNAVDKAPVFRSSYLGENLGLAKNSFSLKGGISWESISGDWYDCAMRYAKFTKTCDWIKSSKKRKSPKYFTEIPFWIMDAMPLIECQGDNMPNTLRYDKPRGKDDWWTEGIELQEKLGVPVGYHIYNWHKIAFNIDYPHFLPAKDDFSRGVQELCKHNVYVMPYINAISWETEDEKINGEPTFKEVGYRYAVKDKNGKFQLMPYPQIKPNGNKTMLCGMCPATKYWQDVMVSLSNKIYNEFEVCGIYYDQAGAVRHVGCTDASHDHAIGNGEYRYEGTRKYMSEISSRNPDKFSVTECNTEVYIDAFDGMLTWDWGDEGEVPAFPAIYSQHTTMVGRVIQKFKKDPFRYRQSLALGFLYGQQIGWINPDVKDNGEVFPMLKELVTLRFNLTSLFTTGQLLRPPKLTSNLPTVKGDTFLYFKNEVTMYPVLTGAWKTKEKDFVYIFVINTADKSGEYSITFNANEYGVCASDIETSDNIIVEGDFITIKGEIAKTSIKTFKVKAK